MTSFLNSESNKYFIKIIDQNNGIIKFSIQEEYYFSLNTKNNQLTTEDDFLEEICQKINQKNLSILDEIFKNFTIEYSILIDDEDLPLYEGQDVFEDENDNHDMKFVDRVRFNYEKFNKDIILNILNFMNVPELLKSSLACKDWYKISQDELIWKNLLNKKAYPYIEKLGYKGSYIEESQNSLKWDVNLYLEITKGTAEENEIRFENNCSTINVITDIPTSWKYVVSKKPLKKNSSFAFKLENLKTSYYFGFALFDKEDNLSKLKPSGSISIVSIFIKHDIIPGQIVGVYFQDTGFDIYVDNIFKQHINNSNMNLYAAICVVDQAKISIVKDWKPPFQKK